MNRTCLQIAFITGRSRPGHCALSPVQRMFLERLAAQDRRLLTVNFPWAAEIAPFAATGILWASLNNARDYLGSRRAQFTHRYQESAMNIVQAADHTLFLAGSCGLELFNNLQLPAAILSRVSLLAYGPVARQRPHCRHLLVQGRQDLISRYWFREPDIQICSGHMSYLEHPELPEICQHFIRTV